ncbi:hypothetical protein K9O30_20760 [Clostridium bowmanii]|uniref:hypothetical protein n=1 Tax=Clostridium bowmanii TaxID=132925 RepID=UPI001C0BEB14|nr:hypothetical protein [Clostridium bowmanii]MBU3191899.1 hypothetical protein [Clostridium bowmanii]MCA1076108.1 hypothetical protein [Clostridium bowmanii]
MEVTLAKSVLGQIKRQIKRKVNMPNGSFSYYSGTGRGKGSSRVTLFGLICKLDMMTWDDYLEHHNERMPSNMQIFLNQAYFTSSRIKIKDESTLQSYKYAYNKIKAMDADDFMFIFLPYVRIDEILKSKKFDKIIMANYSKDGDTGKITEHETYISCSIKMIEEATVSVGACNVQVKDKKGFHTMVGGFVKKNLKGYAEFVSMMFMPIITQGLWAESSYEKEAYSKLVALNIPFSKGYESLNYYNNYEPDIIFRGDQYVERPYIGEVFGVRGDIKYDEKKAKKIELSKTTDYFDFWYWDATQTDTITKFF